MMPWRNVSFYLAQAIGFAICESKLRLGRRRHDKHCDRCEEPCGTYAMDHLVFPIDDLRPEATTAWEKLRALLYAEYERVCLECSVIVEAEGRSP